MKEDKDCAHFLKIRDTVLATFSDLVSFNTITCRLKGMLKKLSYIICTISVTYNLIFTNDYNSASENTITSIVQFIFQTSQFLRTW